MASIFIMVGDEDKSLSYAKREADHVTLPDQFLEPVDQDDEQGDGNQYLASTGTILLYGTTILGIGSGWAVQFALATPYFEKTLLSGRVISHAVWIIGPISGLIVAPLIGILSDRSTNRYGRRRPFIVVGAVAAITSMSVFSHTTELASLFVSPSSPRFHSTALVLGIVAFAGVDLALNLLMWPHRALIGDVIPAVQQHAVQAALTVGLSLSDLATNAMVRSFDEPVTHIRPLYFAVCILIATSTMHILWLARGHDFPFLPLQTLEVNVRTVNGAESGWCRPRLPMLPEWMWRVGLTTALGWFAMFCARPSVSSWLGSSVLGGDPRAEPGSTAATLYEKGVKLYGQASVPRTLLQVVIAVMYPRVTQAGIRPSYQLGVAYVICSIILVLFSQTHNVVLAQLVVVSLALPMAMTFVATNATAVALSSDEDRGANLGILNIFAVIPQMIDTVYTGFVSRAYGDDTVMLIGAGWGIATAVAAFVYAW